MHRLFSRQIAKATKPNGEIDIDRLGELVTAAYEQAENDRRRTDRSIALMVEELDQLTRHLEKQVEERTAALRDREARLAEQNLLFDAALNNMSQGLMMFDADGRVMICNRRYLELYGLTADRVKPGMTLQELLEYRSETNTFSGDPIQYDATLKERIAHGDTHIHIFDLPDGRTISLVSRPMASWPT